MPKTIFPPCLRFAELGRLRFAFHCSEAAVSVAQRHSLAKHRQDGLAKGGALRGPELLKYSGESNFDPSILIVAGGHNALIPT
jgi:hypothetical protein